MNCTETQELSELIAQVEELHFELLEARGADEHRDLSEKRQRLRAYQKRYYANVVKNDEAKMQKRRESSRQLRKTKSAQRQKVPLQGVSQEKSALREDAFVLEF